MWTTTTTGRVYPTPPQKKCPLLFPQTSIATTALLRTVLVARLVLEGFCLWVTSAGIFFSSLQAHSLVCVCITQLLRVLQGLCHSHFLPLTDLIQFFRFEWPKRFCFTTGRSQQGATYQCWLRAPWRIINRKERNCLFNVYVLHVAPHSWVLASWQWAGGAGAFSSRWKADPAYGCLQSAQVSFMARMALTNFICQCEWLTASVPGKMIKHYFVFRTDIRNMGILRPDRIDGLISCWTGALL